MSEPHGQIPNTFEADLPLSQFGFGSFAADLPLSQFGFAPLPVDLPLSQFGHKSFVSDLPLSQFVETPLSPFQQFGLAQALPLSQFEIGGDLPLSQFGFGPFAPDLPLSQFDLAQLPSDLPLSQFGPELPLSQFHTPPMGQIAPATTIRQRRTAGPLRVAHVGLVLYPGGIEMWLRALIRHACPRQIQFTRCLVTTNKYDPGLAADMGVPVETGAGPAAVWRAAANCDVLLVSGPVEVGGWLANMPDRPVCVGIAHGESYGTREILLGCARILDHVVAVGDRVARTVCQGLPTTVIHNGVDTAHLSRSCSREAMRARLGFANDDFVIGSVSRFSYEKRPRVLIEAVSRLPTRHKLLLVGWGPLYEELRYLADRLAPGRVRFAQSHRDLGDYYQAMDVFALASASEGYGLAIMEAMMCQRPVVTTPVGFVPEFVEDRVSGLVVDGSPQAFADAVTRLHNHPDWAAGVAREGFRLAERIGHARDMAMSYERLFADLCRAKFSPRPA